MSRLRHAYVELAPELELGRQEPGVRCAGVETWGDLIPKCDHD
ncbi:hypothetical protein [Kribbella turkmenica]|nr:hypothetical protein [Kribbella turkmenica]